MNFSQDRFDAEAYAEEQMEENDEWEVRRLAQELAEFRRVSAEEMRRSVYANYPAFIRTSKQISAFQVQLKRMREMLTLNTALIHSLAEKGSCQSRTLALSLFAHSSPHHTRRRSEGGGIHDDGSDSSHTPDHSVHSSPPGTPHAGWHGGGARESGQVWSVGSTGSVMGKDGEGGGEVRLRRRRTRGRDGEWEEEEEEEEGMEEGWDEEEREPTEMERYAEALPDVLDGLITEQKIDQAIELLEQGQQMAQLSLQSHERRRNKEGEFAVGEAGEGGGEGVGGEVGGERGKVWDGKGGGEEREEGRVERWLREEEGGVEGEEEEHEVGEEEEKEEEEGEHGEQRRAGSEQGWDERPLTKRSLTGGTRGEEWGYVYEGMGKGSSVDNVPIGGGGLRGSLKESLKEGLKGGVITGPRARSVEENVGNAGLGGERLGTGDVGEGSRQGGSHHVTDDNNITDSSLVPGGDNTPETEPAADGAPATELLSESAALALSAAIAERHVVLVAELERTARHSDVLGEELRFAVTGLMRLGELELAHQLLLGAYGERIRRSARSLHRSATGFGGSYTAALSQVGVRGGEVGVLGGGRKKEGEKGVSLSHTHSCTPLVPPPSPLQIVFSAIGLATADSAIIFANQPACSADLLLWARREVTFAFSLLRRNILCSAASPGGLPSCYLPASLAPTDSSPFSSPTPSPRPSPLSQIVFSAIAQATADSAIIFADQPACSADLLLWARREVTFAFSLLRRNILCSAASPGGLHAASECVCISLGHARLLEPQGICLAPMLGELMRPSVMEALEFNILRIEDAVVSVATTDEWRLEAVELGVMRLRGWGGVLGLSGLRIRLTPSAVRFYLLIVVSGGGDGLPVAAGGHMGCCWGAHGVGVTGRAGAERAEDQAHTECCAILPADRVEDILPGINLKGITLFLSPSSFPAPPCLPLSHSHQDLIEDILPDLIEDILPVIGLHLLDKVLDAIATQFECFASLMELALPEIPPDTTPPPAPGSVGARAQRRRRERAQQMMEGGEDGGRGKGGVRGQVGGVSGSGSESAEGVTVSDGMGGDVMGGEEGGAEREEREKEAGEGNGGAEGEGEEEVWEEVSISRNASQQRLLNGESADAAAAAAAAAGRSSLRDLSSLHDALAQAELEEDTIDHSNPLLDPPANSWHVYHVQEAETEAQQLAVLGNVAALADELLPRLVVRLTIADIEDEEGLGCVGEDEEEESEEGGRDGGGEEGEGVGEGGGDVDGVGAGEMGEGRKKGGRRSKARSTWLERQQYNLAKQKVWRARIQRAAWRIREIFCASLWGGFVFSESGERVLCADEYLGMDACTKLQQWMMHPLPSPPFQALFLTVNAVQSSLERVLRGQEGMHRRLLRRVMEWLLSGLLTESTMWEDIQAANPPLGPIGLHQLVFDMYFVVQAAHSGKTSSPLIRGLAEDAATRAIVAYSARTGEDPKRLVEEDWWYQHKCQTVLEELKEAASQPSSPTGASASTATTPSTFLSDAPFSWLQSNSIKGNGDGDTRGMPGLKVIKRSVVSFSPMRVAPPAIRDARSYTTLTLVFPLNMANRAYLLLPIFVACLILLTEATATAKPSSAAFKRPGVARILKRHNPAGDSSHHHHHGGSQRPSAGGCSSSPSPSSCAFSFGGFQGSIPVFNLPRGETPIGTTLVADGVSIIRLNSDGAQYPCARKGTENLRNQFYARDNVIVMRFVQKGDEGKLRGQLVKVPITSAELKVGKKTVNLNQGQGSDVIPENQRCVLFKIAS
ncbi:unnamed protein product [Closterium sp. Yama58-4]|nr:unnamed protein product [Closterium sp. Yama58-4]